MDKVKNHYRINSLEDYAHFIKSTRNAKSLTIIGSGLVGCEFAQDFTKNFTEIHVLTPDPYPLYGLVPSCIGQALQKNLAEQGIIWHIKTHLSAIEERSESISVCVSKDATITSDAILCAIGLTPNLELAQKAHIQTRQGILVNEYLQTNIPHIYAIGDCAEISGICRQYVAPILHSTRALAQTLNSCPTAVSLPPMPISLKVSSYPIITLAPPASLEGEWRMEENNQGIQAMFYDKDEVLRGYALSGTFLEARQLCLQSLGKLSKTLAL